MQKVEGSNPFIRSIYDGRNGAYAAPFLF
jgi:hypothetical protein